MFDFTITPEREVLTNWDASLEQYQQEMTIDEYTQLRSLSSAFEGKRILFINATAQGGGVALMRHTLMHFFKLFGVDAHWHVLLPDPDVFEITKKKFHNILQAVAPKEVFLTEADMRLYQSWIERNAFVLRSPIRQADVIVIDDPQPAGLIPHIKRMNPQAKIIYRSHIQIESFLANLSETAQHRTWSFLWQYIQWVDLFISHPIEAFVPGTVRNSIIPIVEMPATTDPFDGLNKTLADYEIEAKMNTFNDLLVRDGQTPLDLTRPYIIQYARFDPSKGISDVIESYAKLRRRLSPDVVIPQLVIAGNGSIDDPDGIPLLYATKALVASIYTEFSQDIKILRLDPDDLLANALLRNALLVLQLSHKEGFEVKVTEALMKGKPVIAYKAGGIPLQIKNPSNGFLVDVGATDIVADRLYALITDTQLYSEMSTYATSQSHTQFQTGMNATRWLQNALKVVESSNT